MGSSGSKAARSAGGSATRKYPTRKPNVTTEPSSQIPSAARYPTSPRNDSLTRAQMQASGAKSDAIAQDARDPDFDARLRQVGPVQPNPTFSPSSTSQTQPARSSSTSPGTPASSQPIYPSPSSNPAIAILAARQRIQDEAERERLQIGRPGFEGKTMLDIWALRKALVLRDEQGLDSKEIDKILNLKPGTMNKLGRPGAVEAV